MRVRCYDRRTCITCLTNRCLDRQFTQERNTIICSSYLCTTMGEYLFAMSACRAEEETHILDNTKNRNMNLLEHTNRFPSISKSNILRCRDDNSTGQRNRLNKCQLNITSTRWKIENEIIKFAPHAVCHELLQRTGCHRSAPYNCGIRVNQKTDRHHLHAMRFKRQH